MTRLALLTAAALGLFVVELQLPHLVPIPGVKLGLANIITVYALYRYRAREVLCIVLARILLGAIFAGQMMSFLYSLVGGLLCLAVMIPLRRAIPEKCLWLSSVMGAIAHNVGQIAVAILVTQTPGIAVYLLVLAVSACITGAFTGLCAQLILRRMIRLFS